MKLKRATFCTPRGRQAHRRMIHKNETKIFWPNFKCGSAFLCSLDSPVWSSLLFLWDPGGLFVVAECQTHNGVQTPGSAPTYRWTVGWLLRTGCSSLLYTPCCIRYLKHWEPGSCDRSSTRLQTPDLRTCTLWRGEKGKSIVSKGKAERLKRLLWAFMTFLNPSQFAYATE